MLDNADIKAAHPHLAFTANTWRRAVVGCGLADTLVWVWRAYHAG